jgi:serine/threonine protein kinase
MSDPATLVMGPHDCQRSEQISLQPLRPPTVVPGYEPERFLGRGAFGEVWVAVDCNSGRRVAIKFYSRRGRQDWSSLSREVEKLGLFFNDRYVVQLLRVGWDADPPYYVMEYLENGSLDSQLQEPLPAEQAVTLFREIATGLMHAHNRGVLHCDLKPANILLSDDHKPRLADFGQARLVHEQAPALGTLFYMAPEQADLRAVPDARWDVYGLGVLLYRMLVGDVPYRTDAAVKELDQAQGLEQRLETYRRVLRESPRPSAHRRILDVDRALVQIIDRCLAIDPKHRFPNVQAVLSALDVRAFQRTRRPLVLLGALGPALLLGGMFLFTRAMIVTAVNKTKEQTIAKVQESNHLVARFAADRLAERIQLRWSILEAVAASPRFQELVQEVSANPPTPTTAARPLTPARQQLQEWLRQRRQQYDYLRIDDFWLLLDVSGRLLDVSSDHSSERWRQAITGRFFWNRDGFHGTGVDLDPPLPGQTRPADVVPIKHPHQSLVFRSSEDRHPLIVLFSVPVASKSGLPIGVLAMAVHLGHFSELWWTVSEDAAPGANLKWVTLVQTREQARPPDMEKGRLRNAGLILEHPMLRAAGEGDVPLVYLDRRVWSEMKHSGETDDYCDPFKVQTGTQPNRYLAAAEPVRLTKRDAGAQKDGATSEDTGWLVVVQDDYAMELAPAVQLERMLIWRTLLALAVAAVLVTGLWVVVSGGLIDAPRSRLAAFLRRRSGLAARTSLTTGSGARSSASDIGPITPQGTGSGAGVV